MPTSIKVLNLLLVKVWKRYCGNTWMYIEFQGGKWSHGRAYSVVSCFNLGIRESWNLSDQSEKESSYFCYLLDFVNLPMQSTYLHNSGRLPVGDRLIRVRNLTWPPAVNFIYSDKLIIFPNNIVQISVFSFRPLRRSGSSSSSRAWEAKT